MSQTITTGNTYTSITGLVNGKEYTFQIRAVSSKGIVGEPLIINASPN